MDVATPATATRTSSHSPSRGSQIGGAHASLAAMVFWGLFLRVGYILVAHSYKFRIGQENFGFGWETGRIARSIALGQGFSNPFHGVTGPTAWIAPLYPYVVGGVFKVAGVYSHLSAFILLTINSIFSALTAIPVYFIAKKCFGPRVAKWAGWTWALLPYTMYWAVRWIWETSLTAFLLACAVWIALEIEDKSTNRRWAWFGLVWGIIALTNPACISVLPFMGLWLCWRLHVQKQPWLVPAAISALIFIALVTPWTIRNYQTFGKFIFIRGNAGAELRMGNGPYANGTWKFWLHPTQNVVEFEKYQRMGEAAYVAERQREALDWIKRRPLRFLHISAKKAIYYWAGVPRGSKLAWLAQTKNSLFLASSVLAFWGLLFAFIRRKRSVFVFATLMLVYPITYYLVFPHARYRHPIEPIMLILGVYLISETREARRKAWATATVQRMMTDEAGRVASMLSIIIPCYNEQKTIRNVVDTVRRARLTHGEEDELAKEIVIVDDCSVDGTRDVLAELEEEAKYFDDVRLRIVYHDRNQGKGAAVRTGIQHATGDLVIIQDADLEYDPEDFPALLAPILKGRADAVFGNRFHGGAHRVLYFWHYQANRMLTLVCNMLTDLNLSDMEVGYKVFKREIFQHMTLKSNRFGFEPEVTIKTAKLGCRIYEVPISYHGRTYAEGKKIGWKDGVAALWHMIKFRFFD